MDISSNKFAVVSSKVNKSSLGAINSLVFLFILYALFAFKRIKEIGATELNGVSGTNEIVIYLLFGVLLLFFSKAPLKRKIIFWVAIFTIYLLICSKNVYNKPDFYYALGVFIVPFLFLFGFNIKNKEQSIMIMKIILIICGAYSILALYSVGNYAAMNDMMGNTVKTNLDEQYRPSLMLGSSITVSYYLIITMPIIHFIILNVKERIWKNIAYIVFFLCILSVTLLLSRLAFLVMVVLLILFLFRIKSARRRVILLLSVIIFGGIFIWINDYNIQRLFLGFSDDSSSLSRFDALEVGWIAFRNNPITGTGMGQYYIRTFENNMTVIYGRDSLVDPHNVYILFLSETGIIGTGIIIIGFIFLVKHFFKIKDKGLRFAALSTIFVMGGMLLGGSQLVNEISFSIIFWSYMSLYLACKNINFGEKIETKQQELTGNGE